jgi:hypothetical protein
VKRSQVKPRSDAARDDDARRVEVRERVFWRDGRRCVVRQYAEVSEWVDGELIRTVLPPCSGPLTFAHRRHASSGGAYVEANGNTMCAGHNGYMEDHPHVARILGGETPWWLVVREGDPEWDQLGRKAQGVR